MVGPPTTGAPKTITFVEYPLPTGTDSFVPLCNRVSNLYRDTSGCSSALLCVVLRTGCQYMKKRHWTYSVLWV